MTTMREEVGTMLAQAHEVPLLDQGSIQFILLGVMVLAVLFVLWITIAK
ncbi:MAG TPA: hypothetical protein VMR89_05045 [Actinomycetota bacterium]|jgi:hypothetical protein|nr:hypothetical protein [Actinomycetota bacterium]